jgi:tetraacyldisaccharide 4'-kinase
MHKLGDYLQQAWQQQATWLKLLRPLSCLYRLGFLAQKRLQQPKAYKAPIPLLIIGNITVGGSGKTPLLISLLHYLIQQQVKVGVISRGYGGQGPFPALVHPQALASAVGDEPLLIVQSVQVPMAVGPNRQAAIELLMRAAPDLQLIISDDGLQHFALARDLEWVVLDRMRGLGNQQLLPEGYLREPVSRLAQVTVIEHHPQPISALHMHLHADQIVNLGHVTQPFDPEQHYQAVVGIGYPQRFFQTLQALGIHYSEQVFADHHAYTMADLAEIADQPIITTAKDAVKLQQLWQDQPARLAQVWVVSVRAVLSDACYTTLNQQLRKLDIKV